MFIFSCRLQQRGDPPHLFMNNATITRRRKKLSLHQTPKLVSTSHKGGGGGGEGEARKRKKKRIIIMVKKSL
jgi:ribosome-associated protein YbcJ (S4-like RNA binding protein)